MAKNREPERTMEYETESGEENSEEASSEEDDSSEYDSEPEQNEATKKSSSLPLAVAADKKTPQQQQKKPHSSSDEEESGSESESDSDGRNPNVRPVGKFNDVVRKLGSKPGASESVTPAKSTGAKPLAEGRESEAKDAKRSRKKPESKPSASASVPPTKSTGAKRLAEGRESEAKDAKRSRKKPESEIENTEKRPNDDSKKQLFQRVWSEDDEIAILEGMIDYVQMENSDPVTDLTAFHDFIKDNLHVDVTRTQLQDKIRRLKKKYENNKSKEKEGKDRTFTKPHEQKAYELSKRIWGTENGTKRVESTLKANGPSVRKARTANAVESEDANNLEVGKVDEGWISRTGAKLFEGDKDVKEEWLKLRVGELDLFLKKLELLQARTRLVLDGLRSSDQ